MRKSKDHLADGNGAIQIAALALAKRGVNAELRAKGIRLALVSPAEITEKAKQYLVDNPYLYLVAFERACQLGQIDPSVKEILEKQCRQRVPERIYPFPSELHWNSWFWTGRPDWRDNTRPSAL
jgi:hypothetical protein